jgi:hypothetical protein
LRILLFLVIRYELFRLYIKRQLIKACVASPIRGLSRQLLLWVKLVCRPSSL